MKYIEDLLFEEDAKSGEIMIPNHETGNINTYIEWIKWLEYIPEFEKVRIKELSSKIDKDISLEELDELKRYKNQNRMLGIFKIYGTDKISKEEYKEVYYFMKNHSIDKLMLSKLSSDELEYAKKQIQHFSNISDRDLDMKIEEEQKEENYKKLSMVDSYILHIISKISFSRNITKSNEEMGVQIRENNDMLKRSFNYKK